MIKNLKYANRGRGLEETINYTNQVYQAKGEATIIKIPTSWKVIWQNYKGYRKPINAFPEHKSWLDYIGVIDGVPVTFDAKETNNKTSFPLSNIKEHQIKAMKTWNKCNGVSFLIVYFKQHNECYLMPYKMTINAWNEAKKGGKKSISYSSFKSEAIRINSGNGVFLNWIEAYKTYRGV